MRFDKLAVPLFGVGGVGGELSVQSKLKDGVRCVFGCRVRRDERPEISQPCCLNLLLLFCVCGASDV